MDKIAKALKRLAAEELEAARVILEALANGDIASLDIKKLRGREDVFRVRRGKLRIIYRIAKESKIFILTIERRSDTTYRFHD